MSEDFDIDAHERMLIEFQPTTEAERNRRAYGIRKVESHRKLKAQIDELQAWKNEYLRQQEELDDKELVEMITRQFTSAGLPKSAALVYLSNTPAREVSPTNVNAYIAELKG